MLGLTKVKINLHEKRDWEYREHGIKWVAFESNFLPLCMFVHELNLWSKQKKKMFSRSIRPGTSLIFFCSKEKEKRKIAV